jgi:hypothetical protein
MFEVTLKQTPEQRYVSRTREHVPQEEVEEFVISTLRELAAAHEPSDAPFTVYHGLSPNGDDDAEPTISPRSAARDLPVRARRGAGVRDRVAAAVASSDGGWTKVEGVTEPR